MIAVGSATPATLTSADPAPPPAASNAATLLTAPLPSALAGADPMTILAYIQSKNEDASVSTGTAKVRGFQAEQKEDLEKEQQAIQAAVEASEHQSFWSGLGNVLGQVAKVAAVVASVAAAAATCGAATPLAAVAVAGAVLSTAGFADSEFHVLSALGVDGKTSGLIDTGLSLGGAVCSVGAGALAGGETATTALSTVSRGSAFVAGAATAGQGASTIEAGIAQSQVEQSDADQLQAQSQSSDLLRSIQGVIDQLNDTQKRYVAIEQTIANTKATRDATLVAAASGMKG